MNFEKAVEAIKFLMDKQKAVISAPPFDTQIPVMLLAYAKLKQAGKVDKPMLVITPKSMASYWEDKARFLKLDPEHQLTIGNLHSGNWKERMARLRDNNDVYLMNPEALLYLYQDHDFRKMPFSVVAIKPLDAFKDRRSKRYQFLQSLIKEVPYIWGAIEHSMMAKNDVHMAEALFNQLKLIDGGEAFGKSYMQFRNRYYDQRGPLVWQTGLRTGAMLNILTEAQKTMLIQTEEPPLPYGVLKNEDVAVQTPTVEG